MPARKIIIWTIALLPSVLLALVQFKMFGGKEAMSAWLGFNPARQEALVALPPPQPISARADTKRNGATAGEITGSIGSAPRPNGSQAGKAPGGAGSFASKDSPSSPPLPSARPADADVAKAQAASRRKKAAGEELPLLVRLPLMPFRALLNATENTLRR